MASDRQTDSVLALQAEIDRCRKALKGRLAAKERRGVEGQLRRTRIAMDRTVARLNVEYLRRTVIGDVGETNRQPLLYLLAEEKARLVALEPATQEDKGTAIDSWCSQSPDDGHRFENPKGKL